MQQLERESEDLDQSFQAYLRRQQVLKQQMNDDASRIWENYSLSKAALAQIDPSDNRNTNIKLRPTNLIENMKIDQIWNSTFNDDVNVQDVLKDLNEIKRLKTPPFKKGNVFPADNLKTFQPERSSIDPLMDTVIEKSLYPIIEHKETVLEIKTTFPNKHSSILSDKGYKVQNGSIQNGLEKMKEDRNAQDQKGVKNKAIQALPLEVPSNITFAKPKETVTTRTEIQFSEPKTESLKEASFPRPSTSSNVIIEENGERMKNGQKSPEHLENFTTVDNTKSVQSSEDTQKPGAQVEIKSKFSPLKMNGFGKLGELSESKKTELNGTEKETKIENGNGHRLSQPIGSFANGFSSKLATFVRRISDSDSNEAESEQISIGAQRLVKSPDDFWI